MSFNELLSTVNQYTRNGLDRLSLTLGFRACYMWSHVDDVKCNMFNVSTLVMKLGLE